MTKVLRVRLGITTLVLTVFAGLMTLLQVYGPHAPFWPKCMLHKATGFNCPGCGMTRALSCCLQGEIGMAFRYNPLLMVLLPLTGIGLLLELIGRWRGEPLPVRLTIGKRMGWFLLGLVLVYGVMRNLPWWPFTLLAVPK